MSEYIEHRFDFPDDYSVIVDGGPDVYTLGTYHSGNARYAMLTSTDLHELADFIKESIPQPTILDTAKFIRAQDKHGTPWTLARFDGLWYDEHGDAHTSDWVSKNYDFIEEIA